MVRLCTVLHCRYSEAMCATDSMQDKSSFRVPAADRTPLP